MRKMLTGAAILALVAGTTAVAKPGGGEGKGNAGGGPQVERSVARGNGSAGGRGSGKAVRGPQIAQKEDRGNGRGRDRPERMQPKAEDRARGEVRAERKPEARVRRNETRAEFVRPTRQEVRKEAQVKRDEARMTRREAREERRAERGPAALAERGERPNRFPERFGVRGRAVVQGCPPGLAKKNNGCMPPGLAARSAEPAVAGAAAASLLGAALTPDWFGYDQFGSDYRYYDGYLLRTSGDRVLGYVPLLGGALAPGEAWPAYFEPEPLPPYWIDYYDLEAPDRYRYYDDVLYELDPRGSGIEEIVALMTGDPWLVGEPMPVGYDVYNVPYSYRDRYYDGPEHWYRYADGYLYDIDPETRLVLAIVELLA